jgi:hypothetical protein
MLITASILTLLCYFLLSASYAGKNETLELKAVSSENGAIYHAENAAWQIDVQHAGSLIHSPIVIIKQKHQWFTLLLSLVLGIVSSWLLRKFKKAKNLSTETPPLFYTNNNSIL